MAIDQVTGGLIKNDAITSAKLADNIELQGAQFKIPVHANDSARDSAIGSPAAGMMIFNTSRSCSTIFWYCMVKNEFSTTSFWFRCRTRWCN